MSWASRSPPGIPYSRESEIRNINPVVTGRPIATRGTGTIGSGLRPHASSGAYASQRTAGQPTIESQAVAWCGSDPGTVATSQDGRRIVFPIRGADGTVQLATRLLDEDAVTPLAGTENAADPSFSPDGQWIAFAADNKLKKISVLGGSAVELCDAPNLRGGSWGDDGTIVAALRSTTGLYRCIEAGRTPQPLTKLTNGEVSHRWPQILPGNQFVLFTASKDYAQWEDATIQVLSVKTGQVTPVFSGGYFGRYMAGRLTYVHQGALWGVAFDLATMTNA
jgi:hypothetical protein